MAARQLPGEAQRVGWVERQVRRADRFQQRHAVIAVPWAVMQKFGNDQAGGKAPLMAYYGLASHNGDMLISRRQRAGPRSPIAGEARVPRQQDH